MRKYAYTHSFIVLKKKNSKPLCKYSNCGVDDERDKFIIGAVHRRTTGSVF